MHWITARLPAVVPGAVCASCSFFLANWFRFFKNSCAFRYFNMGHLEKLPIWFLRVVGQLDATMILIFESGEIWDFWS